MRQCVDCCRSWGALESSHRQGQYESRVERGRHQTRLGRGRTRAKHWHAHGGKQSRRHGAECVGNFHRIASVVDRATVRRRRRPAQASLLRPHKARRANFLTLSNNKTNITQPIRCLLFNIQYQTISENKSSSQSNVY